MCSGIALPLSELPVEMLDVPTIRRRVHDREGRPEVRFLWRHRPAYLPVWHEGTLKLAWWGCRRGESRRLPLTGWTWAQTVEAGGWSQIGSEPVDVPACFLLDGGVWIAVREGIRAVLVRDEVGELRVYLITQPATRYYGVMTRSERMPVLINETI